MTWVRRSRVLPRRKKKKKKEDEKIGWIRGEAEAVGDGRWLKRDLGMLMIPQKVTVGVDTAGWSRSRRTTASSRVFLKLERKK